MSKTLTPSEVRATKAIYPASPIIYNNGKIIGRPAYCKLCPAMSKWERLGARYKHVISKHPDNYFKELTLQYSACEKYTMNGVSVNAAAVGLVNGNNNALANTNGSSNSDGANSNGLGSASGSGNGTPSNGGSNGGSNEINLNNLHGLNGLSLTNTFSLNQIVNNETSPVNDENLPAINDNAETSSFQALLRSLQPKNNNNNSLLEDKPEKPQQLDLSMILKQIASQNTSLGNTQENLQIEEQNSQRQDSIVTTPDIKMQEEDTPETEPLPAKRIKTEIDLRTTEAPILNALPETSAAATPREMTLAESVALLTSGNNNSDIKIVLPANNGLLSTTTTDMNKKSNIELTLIDDLQTTNKNSVNTNTISMPQLPLSTSQIISQVVSQIPTHPATQSVQSLTPNKHTPILPKMNTNNVTKIQTTSSNCTCTCQNCHYKDQADKWKKIAFDVLARLDRSTEDIFARVVAGVPEEGKKEIRGLRRGPLSR